MSSSRSLLSSVVPVAGLPSLSYSASGWSMNWSANNIRSVTVRELGPLSEKDLGADDLSAVRAVNARAAGIGQTTPFGTSFFAPFVQCGDRNHVLIRNPIRTQLMLQQQLGDNGQTPFLGLTMHEALLSVPALKPNFLGQDR